jgi:hypothetical protein
MLLPLMMIYPEDAGAQELPSFAILAGSTITNTGPTTITGNIGLSPGLAFPGQNSVTQTGQTFLGDAVAVRVKDDLVTLYNVLASRPTSPFGTMTDPELGGLTLTSGVYSFNDNATLTGTLTLDGGNDPNAVFIFNIESTLVTAVNSEIVLVNGAQGGNVFFRVGSSATLFTSTDFQGQIVALASITLQTTATIDCGAAFARNGAVTLDTNTIGICTIDTAAFEDVLDDDDDGTTPTDNAQAVADALDAYVDGGGVLPSGFAILAMTLTPAELADALAQLSGEVATGVAPTGMQSMDSFLDTVMGGGMRPTPPVAATPPGQSPAGPAPSARSATARSNPPEATIPLPPATPPGPHGSGTSGAAPTAAAA